MVAAQPLLAVAGAFGHALRLLGAGCRTLSQSPKRRKLEICFFGAAQAKTGHYVVARRCSSPAAAAQQRRLALDDSARSSALHRRNRAVCGAASAAIVWHRTTLTHLDSTALPSHCPSLSGGRVAKTLLSTRLGLGAAATAPS